VITMQDTHTPSLGRSLLSLCKPRIVALLTLTGVTAAFAAGGLPAVELLAFVLAGIGMAGGAAALNCYYDRDIDPKMERTADRPLATGHLPPWAGLALGGGLLAAATAIAMAALPTISVVYMWLGVASYVGLYTVLLKRRHWLGVVLGGSAGSFPVLAGWTAVHPVTVPPEPALVMAALVFVWTPAHAWALAVVYREDFATVDIPTLPVVAGPDRTRHAIWLSAVLTVLTAAALLPFAGPAYAGALTASSVLFLLAYRGFHAAGTDPTAVRAFFTSNVFLALLFVGWAVDGLFSVGLAGGLVSAAVSVSLIALLWSRQPSLGGIPAAPAPDLPALATRAYHRVVVTRAP
jgi:protoheme IX farnesyltransferase